MAFAKKQIDVSLSYAAASVGKTSLSGLRISLVVVNAGGDSTGQMEMAIFGLSLSDMNALTILGLNPGTYGSNKVTVTASDGGAPQIVFTGDIQRAVADARGMPEVVFRISAYSVKLQDFIPVQPTSVQGSADAAQVAQQIVGRMGLPFENNGVSVKLSNPYLPGAALTQIRTLAKHAGIAWTVDVDTTTLAIAPTDRVRSGAAILISPATGMVGYPSFTSSGVDVETYFNPSIKLLMSVTIQSDFTPACGQWKVTGVEHQLECEVPRGKWFTFVRTSTIGQQGPGF